MMMIPVLLFNNGTSVSPAVSARNLGTIFDSHLTFEDQIASVSRMGVFRGEAAGAAPPIEEIFAPFKYSLSSFLPNHMYYL